MSEQRMWQRMTDEFTGIVVHASRIENSASDGMPDVHIGYRGRDIWWELKDVTAPKRAGSKVQVKVRRSQVDWFADRHARGKAKGWLLVKVGRELMLFSSPVAIVGLHLKVFTLEEMKEHADFIHTSYRALLRYSHAAVQVRKPD